MYKKFDDLANSIEYTLNDFEGENSGLAEYLNNTLNTSGISIALSQKGDTLAVGVPFIEGGVVFIFKRNKDIGYYHKFSAGTGTEYSTDIGTTVAISPDGLIVAFTFLNNEGYLGVNLLLELRDGSWKNKSIPNPLPLTKEDLGKVTINLTCHPLIMTVETPYGGYIYENRDGVVKLVGRADARNRQGDTPVKNEKEQAPQKDENVESGSKTQRLHQNYQTDERGVKPWQMKPVATYQHTLPANLGLVENDVKVGYADQVVVELQKVLESSKVELDALLKRAGHMREVCAVIEAQINGIKSLKG